MRYQAFIPILCGLTHQFQPENKKLTSNTLNDASRTTDHLIRVFKEKYGIPGISVCVSIGCVSIFSKGYGYADVEQIVPASPSTKYRIASISKCFTSLLTGRLTEQGQLDLNENIQSYLPDIQLKTKDGQSEPITLKQLLSHTSGLRNYRKINATDKEADTSEMLNTKNYASAVEALDMFINDPLDNKPAEKYGYTTHGYTLISAIIESILNKSFHSPFNWSLTSSESIKDPTPLNIGYLLENVFHFLNLKNTCLDNPNAMIPFRSRQYRRNEKGDLIRAPSVDNSYKWGGGGILSTASDLIHFAEHLSTIYIGNLEGPSAIISRDFLTNQLWSPVSGTFQGNWLVGGLYGLGWFVARQSGEAHSANSTYSDRLFVGHLGGSIGGTTALLISLPLANNKPPLSIQCSKTNLNNNCCKVKLDSSVFDRQTAVCNLPPISVVILTNLEQVKGIGRLAVDIVETFTSACVDQLAEKNFNYNNT